MKRILRLARCGMAVVLLSGFWQTARAGSPTAFALMKEGNRYVGEEVKDKVVQIHSEKSIGDLTPNIWYVVFYDRDATFKAIEVKFGAGKKMDVKRPMRVLEYINAEKVLDKKKLNTDSDKALQTAMKEPLLGKLNLKASQLWLENHDGAPIWRVRLWAAKLKNPNDNVDIGEVFVSADDGKVTKVDLHINRVD